MAIQMTEDDKEQQRELATFLKNKRLAMRMTQYELADAIGTAQGNIARMENNEYNLKLQTVQAWMRALGLQLEIVAIAQEDELDKLMREYAEENA